MIRPLPTLLIGILLALPAPALVIDSLAANGTPPADDPGFDNAGRLGVETGIDLDALVEAGRFICAALGRKPASKVALAWAGGDGP